MFDPLYMAELVRHKVCRDGMRKYYRFRPARFYGGIATADSVGCPLRCQFCWSWKEVTDPERWGKFHSPEDVARRLLSIASKKGFRQLRISGNEPTVCREHLIRVLEFIPEEYTFILETNGILIGADRSYAEELSRFSTLHARVSLKGANEEEFSVLTGAEPRGFGLQLKALENLLASGVSVHPACMVSFSSPESIRSLRERLRAIHPPFEDFEVEELILYPSVEERLRKSGLHYRTGHRPQSIPSEQV